MSVYIKGLEMPTNCSRQGCPLFACIAAYKTGMICTVLNEYVEKGKKNPRCPLVPVPPHGRLIESAELYGRAEGIKTKVMSVCDKPQSWQFGVFWAIEQIEAALTNAPTIIPAELSVHHGTFAATSEQEAIRCLTKEDKA